MTAVEHPAADRASAYGLESILIDGNDPDEVHATARRVVDRARAGEGPSLVEAVTYRHGGHSRADPGKYRPDDEVAEWLGRDPIPMYRERLVGEGVDAERAGRDRRRGLGGRRPRDRGVEGRAAARRGLDRHAAVGRRGIRMAELTYREAVARAIAQEMERDPTVYFIGEDIAAAGGVFKTTEGLFDRFGPDRVRDTPISEQAIIGAAMGAAMNGLRPIAELMFSDFFAVCWDLVANQIAKTRYMTNGQVALPLVIRTANGGGVRFGAQHSQSVESWMMAIPGLKVVVPSTPVDMIGLFAAAVRDPDPVIVVEPKVLYSTKGEVPDGEIVDRLGTARVLRPGDDVTICALGAMVPKALAAAERAGRRRRLGRGDRRPLAGAARRARDPGLRRQDQPARHRRGEPAPVRLGSGGRVDRRGRGVLRARRTDRPRDDAAHPVAVRRRARGRCDPVRRSDRRGRPSRRGLSERRPIEGGDDMADRILLRGGHVLTVDPQLGDIPGGDVLIEGDTIVAGRAGHLRRRRGDRRLRATS